MKRIYTFLLIAVSAVFILNSCKKDDDRDAFVGTWKVTEAWTVTGWGSGTDFYNITISKSSTVDNGIIITGFGGSAGVAINATVNGTSMNITSQTFIYDNSVYTGSGSGTISGNTLSYTYNVVGGWYASCTAIKL